MFIVILYASMIYLPAICLFL